MPGLAGIVSCNADSRVPLLLDAMLSQLHHDGAPVQREVLASPASQFAIGRVHLGVLHARAQLRPGGNVQVLFHGDLDNVRELAAQLPDDPFRQEDDAASTVAGLYAKYGAECIGKLSGSFSCCIVDPPRRQLLLAADRLGSYPLYYAADQRGLLFASELKAVAGSRSGTGWDLHAVVDYLNFGFILGDRTHQQGIRVVAPGTTVTYDWESGTVRGRRYSAVEALFEPGVHASRAAYTARTVEAFGEAVARAVSGPHTFGLSLSGGLDSRAVLAAAADRSGLTTCTTGVDGCADQQIAARLAAITNCRHLFAALDPESLHAYVPQLKRVTWLTDGMYLSHGLTELTAIELVARSGVTVLLRGHGGELAKARLAWPLHTDVRIRGMSAPGEAIAYLATRAAYVPAGASIERLLRPQWRWAARDRPRATLQESVSRARLAPSDICVYLYLHELHRRFTVPSLELFRNTVEVRLPFLDWNFLRVLLSGPSEWRDDTSLHRALLARFDPRLLRVRNSNTGVWAGAPWWIEAGFDKAHGALRKLRIRGFRHYHDFDAWMRKTFIASVKQQLVDRDAFVFELFERKALAQLIDDTATGRGDHGYLLQVILNLEVWRRELETWHSTRRVA